MEEAVKALLEAFAAKIEGRIVGLEAKIDGVAKLTESADEAKAEKVDALEVADKLTEAKLSESGRKRVLESVTGGLSIADAILAESKLRDEYLAEHQAERGGRGHAVSGTDADFTVNGWN